MSLIFSTCVNYGFIASSLQRGRGKEDDLDIPGERWYSPVLVRAGCVNDSELS